MSEYFIGLMSGTSLDGADGVLVDFSDGSSRVVADASVPFDAEFRSQLFELNSPGSNELHRAALAANQLASLYAQAVHALLDKAAVHGLGASDVQAIGAHGQTVRHQPSMARTHSAPALSAYTLQLNNPALMAELCGIDVVADFRSADVAAGGQGAPLVPAFHQALWADPARSRAVLNVGGISNLTLLPAGGDVSGFDCGPGNALMDFWCLQHTGQAFDAEGAWAAGGEVQAALLHKLLDEPYFDLPPPKSTGRDLFNPRWLEAQLLTFSPLEPPDVQATLTALTAQVCARDLRRLLPEANELLVCGGGALNTELMRQLQGALPGVSVRSTQTAGLPPLQVEAAAFAWLARAWHRGQPGNLVHATGASGARVLGALYKAPKR